ncbi:hypothetical protein BDD12DRAFT_914004 [Trichophaea hybrida]|nr:hypothetical protein BDD12DRAFT_914004 [Trichophaea hybrida]
MKISDCVNFAREGICRRKDCPYRHFDYTIGRGYCNQYEASNGTHCHRGINCKYCHCSTRLQPCNNFFIDGSCFFPASRCQYSHGRGVVGPIFIQHHLQNNNNRYNLQNNKIQDRNTVATQMRINNGFGSPLMGIYNAQHSVQISQQNFIYQPKRNHQTVWFNHNQNMAVHNESNATGFQHNRRHGTKWYGAYDTTEAKELTGSGHVISKTSFRRIGNTLGSELDSQGGLSENSNGDTNENRTDTLEGMSIVKSKTQTVDAPGSVPASPPERRGSLCQPVPEEEMQKFKERAKASLVKLGVQASAKLNELRQRALDSMSPKPEDRGEWLGDRDQEEKPTEENITENTADPKTMVAETNGTDLTTDGYFMLDTLEEGEYNYESGTSSTTSLQANSTPDTTPPSSPINKRTFSDASLAEVDGDEERYGKRCKVEQASFQAPVMTYSTYSSYSPDLEDVVDWGSEDDDVC